MKIIPKIISVVLLITIVIELVNFLRIPLVKETIANATTIKPETFTELYFENHNSLPSNITYSGDINFSFTIHNLENRDVTYPYVVSYEVNGRQVPIVNDNVNVPQNNYKTIPITVPTVDLRPIKIVVQLTNKSQVISFWII